MFILRSQGSTNSMWSASRLDCLADQALSMFLHSNRGTNLVRRSRKGKAPLRESVEVQKQIASLPMLFIHSVSELLHQHQGYTRMEHHGNPDSYLFSSVMENGQGSPIILSIIFREVNFYPILSYCLRFGEFSRAAETVTHEHSCFFFRDPNYSCNGQI